MSTIADVKLRHYQPSLLIALGGPFWRFLRFDAFGHLDAHGFQPIPDLTPDFGRSTVAGRKYTGEAVTKIGGDGEWPAHS